MKEIFNDIRNTEDFEGIILFSPDGEALYQEFLFAHSEEIKNKELWSLFIHSLNGVREVDLVFEKKRLYIRETDMGYLIIIMGVFAPIAKISLYCDLLLPSLKKKKAGKGFKRIFKSGRS